MSEAELLEIRGELTAIVISVVSVSFGMVSAYIAGLWLFLKHATLGLRLITFAMLGGGLAFMGVVTFGVHEIFLGLDRAWRDLPDKVTGLESFGDVRPPILQGVSVYEAAVMLGFAAFLMIYLALGHLTFFYRWPEPTPRALI